ncbi:MAG: DUF7146 domain-containing protein, partial [Planctomycetia bacterium]
RAIEPAAGVLFCNQCFHGKNGDVFAAIGWFRGWSFPETVKAVAVHLGMADGPPPPGYFRPPIPTAAPTTAPAPSSAKATTAAARRLYDHAWSGHSAWTAWSTYLQSRDLPVPPEDVPADFRFEPAGRCDRVRHPMLVAPVVDLSSGELLAVHRTFVRGDLRGKADVPRPKRMLGPLGAGAVVLAPLADAREVALVEGVETGFAVQCVLGLPTVAALSASRLHRVDFPDGVEAVRLYADRDPNGVGLAAARRAAARLQNLGLDVSIRLPRVWKGGRG